MNPTKSDLISRRTVAQMLNIHPDTLSLHLKEGKIKLSIIQVGSLMKFKESEVKALLSDSDDKARND